MPKNVALSAVLDALAAGRVLRFESPAFAEVGRRPRTGPTYKADAVLRAVRLRRAVIDVSHETGGVGEIRVSAPQQPAPRDYASVRKDVYG